MKPLVIKIDKDGGAKLPRGWRKHFRTDRQLFAEMDKRRMVRLKQQAKIKDQIIIDSNGNAKLSAYAVVTNKIYKEIDLLRSTTSYDSDVNVYLARYDQLIKLLKRLEKGEDPVLVMLEGWPTV